MLLYTDRQLLHRGQSIGPGGQFEESDPKEIERLLSLPGIRRAEAPRVLYETKVIYPEAPEVSASTPFRHVPVSDTEPSGVVAEGAPVLESSNISEPRAAGRGKRRARRKNRDR